MSFHFFLFYYNRPCIPLRMEDLMNEQFQDRIPPQNIEAEQAVLGAIFLEPSSLTVTSEVINSRGFLP